MNYRLVIAQCIRQCRVEAGLTQQGLADITGINVTTIGYIEQCRENPSLDTLCTICEALDIHPCMLFISSIFYIRTLGVPAKILLPTKIKIGDSGVFYYNDVGFQISVLNAADMKFLLSVMTMRRNNLLNYEQDSEQ